MSEQNFNVVGSNDLIVIEMLKKMGFNVRGLKKVEILFEANKLVEIKTESYMEKDGVLELGTVFSKYELHKKE